METRSYDIVIVGSGAGGGTVAAGLSGLAEQGARIAVLEAGPRLRQEEFTGHELEMARRLYVDSGGMLTEDRSITLAMGRAYGGSTVVYTGVTLEIPEKIVEEWGVPGLDFQDLNRRSRRLSAELGVHCLDDDLINENNRAFARGCRKLGWNLNKIPLNIRDCRGAGICNLGCPHGAKTGTHRLQLPRAEKAGIEVITNCRVETISQGRLQTLVTNSSSGLPSSWPEGRYRIEASKIVLAGNAIGSTSLLLRSGFGRIFPALGLGLTLHPALILAAEHASEISNTIGHPKSYYTDQFQKDGRFLLEVCMYYPFTTAKNLIGFGPEHAEAMRAMPRMQQILALVMDDAEDHNRVLLNRRDETVVKYSLSQKSLTSLHQAMLRATEIFFAAGARRVHVPASRKFWIRAGESPEAMIPRSGVLPGRLSISSAHLMGGCRMGRDVSDSVTDSWGRVHGHPWLLVADSSLFPRCSEVNPHLTVMALADRVAEGIRTGK